MIAMSRLAQPMLASVFISRGVAVLQRPDAATALAGPIVTRTSSFSPLTCDPRDTVRMNGAIQAAAGTLLSLGRMPRLAASVLALSLIPTTLAGHPFWKEQDLAIRELQRTQFLKNLGLLGGLILAMSTGKNARSSGQIGHRARLPAALDGDTAAVNRD